MYLVKLTLNNISECAGGKENIEQPIYDSDEEGNKTDANGAECITCCAARG